MPVNKYNIYIICKDEEIFMENQENYMYYKSKITSYNWCLPNI